MLGADPRLDLRSRTLQVIYAGKHPQGIEHCPVVDAHSIVSRSKKQNNWIVQAAAQLYSAYCLNAICALSGLHAFVSFGQPQRNRCHRSTGHGDAHLPRVHGLRQVGHWVVPWAQSYLKQMEGNWDL